MDIKEIKIPIGQSPMDIKEIKISVGGSPMDIKEITINFLSFSLSLSKNTQFYL